MTEVVYKWGAMYLVSDQPVKTDPVIIKSIQGLTLEPGESISRIGSKPRVRFELKDGNKMTYEGLVVVQGIQYAVFSVPGFDDQKLNYRYAFATVFVKEVFHCFLIINKNQSREVLLDFKA